MINKSLQYLVIFFKIKLAKREFGQDTGVTPLFTMSVMGFLMTTDSQALGLTSHPKDGAFYSTVSPSLYWGVRTHTDHR